MISKVNIKGPKYLCALDKFELAHDVANIIDRGEYIIEYTEVSTEEVYFRLFFKYENTYQVRYTGESQESCIAYLDKIPQSASVITVTDIIKVCQDAQKGTRKLYKYPLDGATVPTLKNFKDIQGLIND